MAACDTCGTTIIFGGTKDGDLRFCNATCHGRGGLVVLARQLPPDAVKQQTWATHHGSCPKCQGPGPIDVHTAYQVWSALVLTSWKNTPEISCRSCGRKRQIGQALFSLLFGWWGLPWGLIMTPIQVVRNIAAAVRSDRDVGPSPELERIVGLTMAAEVARRQQFTG